MSARTMDFFEHQRDARRRTGRLVLFFLLAVILIVLAVYAAVSVIVFGFALREGATLEQAPIWRADVFLVVSAVTLVLIAAGSAYKVWSLSEGGKAVARMLGGRLLVPDTRDPDERKLLNVVEEMAIASGTPVPPVYLLPDSRINAFAAGFSPSDAVIGVTQGCMVLLTRDELQGVIAHEFSHILNGDMRLNIRLIGILQGILLVGLVGHVMFRGVAIGGRGNRRRGGKGGGGTAMLLLLGVMLMVIGYIGVFFGKLIKSAVSRQREFLADASAVQFTRSPSGIAGALKKIGGLVGGSRIDNPNAETASHLFFGNALGSSFVSLMATHPPLGERIRRIDPSFNGAFPRVESPDSGRPALKDQYPGISGLRDKARDVQLPPAQGRFSAVPAAVMAQVGAPDAAHLAYAKRLRDSIAPDLRDAARGPYSARAVIYGMLADENATMRQQQLKRLRVGADPGVYALTEKLLCALDALPTECRLPLIDMCVPALLELSDQQYKDFRRNVAELVQADAEISLFEYMLQRILFRHLDVATGRVSPRPAQYYSLEPMRHACAALLSTLTFAGTGDAASAQRAFDAGARKLGLPSPSITLLPEAQRGLSAVDSALDRLVTASPMQKRSVMDACATCVLVDRKVTVQEVELLRTVADSLGCPMPPVLPGETVSDDG